MPSPDLGYGTCRLLFAFSLLRILLIVRGTGGGGGGMFGGGGGGNEMKIGTWNEGGGGGNGSNSAATFEIGTFNISSPSSGGGTGSTSNHFHSQSGNNVQGGPGIRETGIIEKLLVRCCLEPSYAFYIMIAILHLSSYYARFRTCLNES